MVRYLIVSVLALGIGVAAYVGWAEIRDSSASRPRVVTLRNQDVAVFGRIQCIANHEAGVDHFLCSQRPRSKATYDTAVFPSEVLVYRNGEPDDPLYVTP